jgi:hypothetical protein
LAVAIGVVKALPAMPFFAIRATKGFAIDVVFALLAFCRAPKQFFYLCTLGPYLRAIVTTQHYLTRFLNYQVHHAIAMVVYLC